MNQQAAALLTAAAGIQAFENLVQRMRHFWLSFLRERPDLFRSPHSLDAGRGEMVHENIEAEPPAKKFARNAVRFLARLRFSGKARPMDASRVSPASWP